MIYRNSTVISEHGYDKNVAQVTTSVEQSELRRLQGILISHTKKPSREETINLLDCMRPTMDDTVPQIIHKEVVDENEDSNKVCAICSDRSTGRHYKVYSCEGCKNFFRRSVRKDVKYVCPAYGKCPVHKDQRTRCKACRLKKCLKVGMRKEGNIYVLPSKISSG